MDRKFEVSRKTGETDITLSINIDGSGKSNISTGVGFLTICLICLQNTVFSTWM